MQFLLILNGKAKRSAGKRSKVARQIRNDLGSKDWSMAWGPLQWRVNHGTT